MAVQHPGAGSATWLGIAAIVFAIAFNIPFSILASIFNYPDILRQPASDVLAQFAAGGTRLIFTWYGFMLAALLFIPLTVALSVTSRRMASMPALSLMAAICGALAGFAQAIGLSRWVFVVPGLAASLADPAATEATRAAVLSEFDLINRYGGIAIGEHLGQLLTAAFAFCLALLQAREGQKMTSAIGLLTAIALLLGTLEGISIATGTAGDIWGLVTVGAFLLLTLWLIVTGIGLIRAKQP